jgi:hypothetical protein
MFINLIFGTRQTLRYHCRSDGAGNILTRSNAQILTDLTTPDPRGLNGPMYRIWDIAGLGTDQAAVARVLTPVNMIWNILPLTGSDPVANGGGWFVFVDRDVNGRPRFEIETLAIPGAFAECYLTIECRHSLIW